MFRGLYTATSGMQLEQKRLDVTSNNIANVNTTAFKRDVIISEAFPEVLMKKINGVLPSHPINTNGYLEVDRDGEIYNVTTDKGFFIVDSPKGTNYSRDISFAVDENGYLRTFGRDIDGQVDASEGNFILDNQRRRIQVEGGDIDIDDNGQLTAGGAQANILYRPDRNVIGTINSGRRFEKTQYNFTQGILEDTGNNLDFAIEGRGFFKLRTPDGEEMYTRNGNFFINENNELVNEEGYFLVGIEGNIVIDGDDFYVTNNGEFIVDNEELAGQIDMINILNLKDLNKIGHAYYTLKDGVEPDEAPFEGQIVQGYLEGSNINTVNEMVEMINIMRAYESNSKVLRAYDEILQRAVNEIGKV